MEIGVEAKFESKQALLTPVKRRRSLYWRLPLSYALIAVLTAAVLGVVLVIALFLVYQQREQHFLQQSALALRPLATDALSSGEAERAVEGWALWADLNQIRIRILDQTSTVLADSGSPNPFEFISGPVFRLPESGSTPPPDLGVWELPGIEPIPPIYSQGQLYGLQQTFAAGSLSALLIRPERQMILPLYAEGGRLTGYLQLDGGPNESMSIIAGVGIAWALAATIAVTVAAVSGWITSRKLSAPIRALTGAATRMGAGDLEARADIYSEDELGILGATFDHMADQVEWTVEALRRFVADAAHELNTPLAALRNGLELALAEFDIGEKNVLLQQALEQTLRLETLVAGLLDLSRLEAVTAATEFAHADLVGIVLKSSEIFASQAEQKGVEFSLTAPESEVWIVGNAGEWGQAVANLLDNAVKFTPPGGQVRISVGTEGNYGTVIVEDTGIGIPEEDLSHLFQRFHRGRNAAAFPGSGLGLALVLAIVGRYGGSIAAANTGAGSRFVLQIPLENSL